jgi:hypothetical protein
MRAIKEFRDPFGYVIRPGDEYDAAHAAVASAPDAFEPVVAT